MADTSPGKVQALRAMFAEKESPVMGLLPMHNKIGPRPWKQPSSPLCENSQQLSGNNPLYHRAINGTVLHKPQSSNVPSNNDVNLICDKPRKVPLKPLIGPKPFYVRSPSRTADSPTKNLLATNRLEHSLPKQRCESPVSSKNYGTIAALADEVKSSVDTNSLSNSQTPVIQSSCDPPSDCSKSENEPQLDSDSKFSSCLNLINSDNYICKGTRSWIRRELPPLDTLGAPPLKPTRPPDMRLREKFLLRSERKTTAPPKPARTSLGATPPPKPNYPCPPRPSTSPPLPPLSRSKGADSQQSRVSAAQDDELYGDTLVDEAAENHVPITTDPEEESELYDDGTDLTTAVENSPCILKPKPLPPLPSLSSQSYFQDSNEDAGTDLLYDDISEQNTDEEYEYPVEKTPENHYTNNQFEIEKVKLDEKLKRKQEKERERKEKEFSKVKKKFGMTGDEVAIDAGLVKADSRGGRIDLQVKKGEIIHILRIEGNPPGKWLARNKKGKYGYVELTNIEVDPDSVKSVMSIRRCSVISASDELYSEANSDEGIYELTY